VQNTGNNYNTAGHIAESRLSTKPDSNVSLKHFKH